MADELVQLATRLTDSQISDLRAILQKDLLTSRNGGAVKLSQDEENDLIDLIDYAVAMVKNGKHISYIVDELKSMEMEIFDWAKVGVCVEQFLRELLPKDLISVQNPVTQSVINPSASATTSAADSRKMLHLKSEKINALAISGPLGASREGRGQVPGDRKKATDTKSLERPIDIPRELTHEDGIDRKKFNTDRKSQNDLRQGSIGKRNESTNTHISGQDNRNSRQTGAQTGRGVSHGPERDHGNIAQRQEGGGRDLIQRRDHGRNQPPREDAGRGFPQRQGRGQDRSDPRGQLGGRGATQGPGRGREFANRNQGGESNLQPNSRETPRDSGRGRGLDERPRSQFTHTTNDKPANPPNKTFDTTGGRDSKYNSDTRGPVTHNLNNRSGVEGSERKAVKRNAPDLNVPATSVGSAKLSEDKVIPDGKFGDPKQLSGTAALNSEQTHHNNGGKDLAAVGIDRQYLNRRVSRGGRSDFSSGRGRGYYGQGRSENRVNGSVQQVAKDPSSDDQVSKRARLSTDMETTADPASQPDEAQNVNTDMQVDDQGGLYQQPNGYDFYDESQWYMEDPSYYAVHPYQWGRGRGYGRGYAFRGRSLRLGGRGLVAPTANGSTDSAPNDNEVPNEEQPSSGTVEDSTLAAAAVSPSPLVAATFGDQLAHVDASFAYRGRGFRGRGGRGRGRADVTAMLASKSWSRAKAVSENSAAVAPTEESGDL